MAMLCLAKAACTGRQQFRTCGRAHPTGPAPRLQPVCYTTHRTCSSTQRFVSGTGLSSLTRNGSIACSSRAYSGSSTDYSCAASCSFQQQSLPFQRTQNGKGLTSNGAVSSIRCCSSSVYGQAARCRPKSTPPLLVASSRVAAEVSGRQKHAVRAFAQDSQADSAPDRLNNMESNTGNNSSSTSSASTSSSSSSSSSTSSSHSNETVAAHPNASQRLRQGSLKSLMQNDAASRSGGYPARVRPTRRPSLAQRQTRTHEKPRMGTVPEQCPTMQPLYQSELICTEGAAENPLTGVHDKLVHMLVGVDKGEQERLQKELGLPKPPMGPRLIGPVPNSAIVNGVLHCSCGLPIRRHHAKSGVDWWQCRNENINDTCFLVECEEYERANNGEEGMEQYLQAAKEAAKMSAEEAKAAEVNPEHLVKFKESPRTTQGWQMPKAFMEQLGAWTEKKVFIDFLANNLPGFGKDNWWSENGRLMYPSSNAKKNEGLLKIYSNVFGESEAQNVETPFDFIWRDSTDNPVLGLPGRIYLFEIKGMRGRAVRRRGLQPFNVTEREWRMAQALHKSCVATYCIIVVDRHQNTKARYAAVIIDPYALSRKGDAQGGITIKRRANGLFAVTQYPILNGVDKFD